MAHLLTLFKFYEAVSLALLNVHADTRVFQIVIYIWQCFLALKRRCFIGNRVLSMYMSLSDEFVAYLDVKSRVSYSKSEQCLL